MAKIYLVGDEKYTFEQTKRALTEDVAYFQLRLKRASDSDFLEEARAYHDICKERGITFIINDRLHIAKTIDADGLHIGQDDLSYSFCREHLPDKIIGLSVHNLEEAKQAFMMGVDYIGIGAMYATQTKSDARVIGLEGLREVVPFATCDIVAIGGIDTTNYQAVYDAGADMLAVSSAVLGSENPAEVLKILRGER